MQSTVVKDKFVNVVRPVQPARSPRACTAAGIIAMTERAATGPTRARTPLLELRRARARASAPVQALRGVDLDIPAGQVTALVGDNGAGKSVLIKYIAGIHTPDGGEILLGRAPACTSARPRDAAALGIETVHQDLALCDNLDIVQNMFLGRERTRARAARRGGAWRRSARRDADQPLGHDRALGPPAGRLAVGRAAPVGGDRQGGAVELESS